MDKKQKKPADQVDENMAAEEVDNVEKIRDILFGTQSKEIDLRFQKLENNISDQIASMHKESSQRFDEMQGALDSEVGILDSKLSTSEKSGFDEMDKIEAELKSQVKRIEDNFAQSSQALEKLSKDIQDKLDSLNQNIHDDLEARFKKTNSVIEKYHEDLKASKLDKSALSKMFASLAEQLDPKKKKS